MSELKSIEITPYVWARIKQTVGDAAETNPQEVVTYLLGLGCGTFIRHGVQQKSAETEAVVKLAAEFCDAVDAESEDVGGHRPSHVILAELGPAVDKVLPRGKPHDVRR